MKTELMLRYEAETDEMSTWTWHNREFVTDDVLEWAHEKIQALEAQLTWRDASETPDSYARYYCKGYIEYSKGIKQNTKNIFAFDEYGWNFPVGYTLIKWLPIPKGRI